MFELRVATTQLRVICVWIRRSKFGSTYPASLVRLLGEHAVSRSVTSREPKDTVPHPRAKLREREGSRVAIHTLRCAGPIIRLSFAKLDHGFIPSQRLIL